MSEPYTIQQILEDTPDRSLLILAKQMEIQSPENKSRAQLIAELRPLIEAQAG